MAHNLQQEISLRQNKVSKVLDGIVTAVLSHVNVRDLNYANDQTKMEAWEKKMQELIGGHRANYANEDNFNAILAEIEQLRDHDSSHFVSHQRSDRSTLSASLTDKSSPQFAPHYDKATGRTTHEIQVIFEPLKVLKKVEEASRKNIYGSGLNVSSSYIRSTGETDHYRFSLSSDCPKPQILSANVAGLDTGKLQ